VADFELPEAFWHSLFEFQIIDPSMRWSGSKAPDYLLDRLV